MSASMPSKGRTIAIWALRVVLGVIFLGIGATKLAGTAQTVQYFAAIGWGQWFRYLTGLLDVVGSALLFVPRRTFYGAAVLACSVGTATLISISLLRGDPLWGGREMTLVPLILTVLVVVLAWLTRPRWAGIQRPH
jgi:putative oxidoreductase